MAKSGRLFGITEAEEKEQFQKISALQRKRVTALKDSISAMKREYQELDDEFALDDKQALGMLKNLKTRIYEDQKALQHAEKVLGKPYFGRIDILEKKEIGPESFYIGKKVITDDRSNLLVMDWRSPLASVYYENHLGRVGYFVEDQPETFVDLQRKRSYEIEGGKLLGFYDSEVVANDDLLNRYLAKSKRKVLNEIIATIQTEQNRIIRMDPRRNLLVQGAAGSGKTTVAMHRISYILYNFDKYFYPENFYIVGSNRILLNYITGILPDLDVENVPQMTMEQLFTRLMYEDWNEKSGRIRPLLETPEVSVKGRSSWFQRLKKFLERYERGTIPSRNIYIRKNGVCLMKKAEIDRFIETRTTLSMEEKIRELNEWLNGRLENEIFGKNVTYAGEERKEVLDMCRHYFGKGVFRGSIYQLYEMFLEEARESGISVSYEKGNYDLYDLAALAYIYRRIKETDGIVEASHVVIDEAQDFGMMAYHVMHACLRRCTYTIMGDVSQNIHYGAGLNDWEELRELMLSGDRGTFGILKKSYRNTVEISEKATAVLSHGTFPMYPVEPLVRHGEPVETVSVKNRAELIRKSAELLKSLQKKGHETLAVIVPDAKEAARAGEELSAYLPVRVSDENTSEFGTGVMVMTVELTKGLEFDGVLLLNPSEEAFPPDNQSVKLLYVACTRALHELKILELDPLTPLLGGLDQKNREAHLQDVTISEEEIELNRKRVEWALRDKKKQTEPEKFALDSIVSKDRFIKDGRIDENKGNYGITRRTPGGSKPTPGSAAGAGAPASGPAFGTLVPQNLIRPKGHSTIDLAVRWSRDTGDGLEVVSAYGCLKLTPMSENRVHVCFLKGQGSSELRPVKPEQKVRYQVKTLQTAVSLILPKLIVSIDKRTGFMTFTDPRGVIYVSEKLPARQIDGKESWTYFGFDKKEIVKARGITKGSLEDLANKARYISFPGNATRRPFLCSNRGYGILLPAGRLLSSCMIPMYGAYIYAGEGEISYDFLAGVTAEELYEAN